MCYYIHWIQLESCNDLAFVIFLVSILLNVCTYGFDFFFISSINYILMCLDMTDILLQNFISLSLITESVLPDDQMRRLSSRYQLHYPLCKLIKRVNEISKNRFFSLFILDTWDLKQRTKIT